jgi:hypothetical protein
MSCNETLSTTRYRKIDMTIKTPVARIKSLVAARQERRYEDMIVASQAKLAETILVPGYTKIYA